jgi:hypothetical protein
MTKSFDIKLILVWSARILLAFVLSGLGTWVMMYILRLDLTHDPILIGLMFGLFFGIIIGRWWAGLILALLLVLISWDDPDISGFDEEAERVFGILIAASVTSLISGYLLSLARRLNLDKFSRPYKGHLKESETSPS